MHEENGIKFYLSAGVKEIVGDEGGRVKGVTLPSGENLEAEVVVAGVGKTESQLFLSGDEADSVFVGMASS